MGQLKITVGSKIKLEIFLTSIDTELVKKSIPDDGQTICGVLGSSILRIASVKGPVALTTQLAFVVQVSPETRIDD